MSGLAMEAESPLQAIILRRVAEDRLLLFIAQSHGLTPVAELAQPRDDFDARRVRIS
jgi:hypothetical protein